MSNSPSQQTSQIDPEAATATVLAELTPKAASSAELKAPAPVKAAKAPAQVTAKAGQPVTKLPASVASKAPAKIKASPAAKAKPAAAKAVKVPAPAKAKAPAPAKARASEPPAQVLLLATSKAAPKAKPGNAVKDGKEKRHAARKPKLVRDSFTFPEADYAQIGILKQRALKAGHEVKKSELLRAGLAALSALPEAALRKALDGIDKLKPGRPAR